MRINNIIDSCDICKDLIPLVLDDVASDHSRIFVLKHVEACQQCQLILNGLENPQLHKADDHKILFSIKKKLYISGIVLLLLGIVFGVYLSNSMGMFYNFIIMPGIGALGYHIFDRRWYIAPFGVFVFSYLWLFIGFIISYTVISIEIFTMPMYLSFIYAGLTTLGVVISALLKFAFKKEDSKC